jgi:hypothetical protein
MLSRRQFLAFNDAGTGLGLDQTDEISRSQRISSLKAAVASV